MSRPARSHSRRRRWTSASKLSRCNPRSQLADRRSRMSDRPDALPADLDDAVARARPRLGRLASSVLYFATVGSTNDVASRLAAAGTEAGAVVVADAQTAGRGRRGRQWFSPPLSGLYVSVVLDVPGNEGPEAAAGARGSGNRARSLLTLAAGVALAEGVHAVTG